MHSFRNLMFVALFCAAPVCLAFGQNKNMKTKWGEIPPEDLAMTVYDKDSSATGVVLQALGTMAVIFGRTGLDAYFSEHRRIKILDPAAYEKGNIEIPYYYYGGSSKVSKLEVQVFYPNGENQKIDSDEVFTERKSKYVKVKKVFVPNLQKGCVLEYRYDVKFEKSLAYFLRPWYFESDLPTRYSEIRLEYPSNILYQCLLKDPNKLIQVSDKFERDSRVQYYHVEYAPAVKEEPFITTTDDYTDQVSFFLSHYKDSYENVQKIMPDSWLVLAKEIFEQSEIGDATNPKGKSGKDLFNAFKAEYPLENDSVAGIAEHALRFVARNIAFNGDYDNWPDQSPDKAFEKRTGSSSDINTALLSVLRHAQLEAYPVMVSTIENGKFQITYPSIEGFNSLIVALKHNDSWILLDATSPFVKFGNLTAAHYNEIGWLMDPKMDDWLEFGTPESSDVWLVDLKLDEEGNAKGKITVQADGNEALQWRRALDKATPQAFVLEEFFDKNEAIAIDSVRVIGGDDFGKPLQLKFNASFKEFATIANEFMYCSPVVHRMFSAPPFKATKRTLPVSMVFPIKQDYVVNLELPKGYVLEELPKPETTKLANNAGRAGVACSQPMPGKVQIAIKNRLVQTEFSNEEYPVLKQFFDAISKNSDIQLTLKKTE
jgi:hypothetical protein